MECPMRKELGKHSLVYPFWKLNNEYEHMKDFKGVLQKEFFLIGLYLVPSKLI